MKISYAITICNELEEIKCLLSILRLHKLPDDEICVLLDKPKASQELLDQLYKWSSKDYIILKESEFKGHFSDWKNELTQMCSGDYIFQIDADEYPHPEFIENLPAVLEHNSAVELYAVPRVNTVEGLTPEHIQKWGWNINEKGWVNWPDFQTRIYRNNGEVKWKNKVHERLEGHKEFAFLPMEEEWALYHIKTIEKQEKQNNYYNEL
jgi:hypothetical protein